MDKTWTDEHYENYVVRKVGTNHYVNEHGLDYLQTNYYNSKNNRVALPCYSGVSYKIEIEYVSEE